MPDTLSPEQANGILQENLDSPVVEMDLPKWSIVQKLIDMRFEDTMVESIENI